MPVLRDSRGQLQKGTDCINPSGKPLGLGRAIREELGPDGARILQRMIEIGLDDRPGYGARERLDALKWIADRGWGKAPDVSLNVNADVSAQAQDVASDALAELADAWGADDGGPDVEGFLIGDTAEPNPENY